VFLVLAPLYIALPPVPPLAICMHLSSVGKFVTYYVCIPLVFFNQKFNNIGNMHKQVPTGGVAAAHSPAEDSWTPFRSPRFSQVDLEHMYFVEGPSRREATYRGTVEMVAELGGLIRSQRYVVQTVKVRPVFRELPMHLLYCTQEGTSFWCLAIISVHQLQIFYIYTTHSASLLSAVRVVR
jgi:hypothetical protein